jgi:hypothetical protein
MNIKKALEEKDRATPAAYVFGVAQTSKSAVPQLFQNRKAHCREADLEVGDRAGLETCATSPWC